MKDAFASRFAGGGYAASVASLTLGDRFNLPRDACGIRFLGTEKHKTILQLLSIKFQHQERAV